MSTVFSQLVYIANYRNKIRGRRVTALGVIFNATGLDTHASVHPAKDMATEEWVCHSPFPSYYVLIIIMRSLLT